MLSPLRAISPKNTKDLHDANSLSIGLEQTVCILNQIAFSFCDQSLISRYDACSGDRGRSANGRDRGGVGWGRYAGRPAKSRAVDEKRSAASKLFIEEIKK